MTTKKKKKAYHNSSFKTINQRNVARRKKRHRGTKIRMTAD